MPFPMRPICPIPAVYKQNGGPSMGLKRSNASPNKDGELISQVEGH